MKDRCFSKGLKSSKSSISTTHKHLFSEIGGRIWLRRTGRELRRLCYQRLKILDMSILKRNLRCMEKLSFSWSTVMLLVDLTTPFWWQQTHGSTWPVKELSESIHDMLLATGFCVSRLHVLGYVHLSALPFNRRHGEDTSKSFRHQIWDRSHGNLRVPSQGYHPCRK